MVFEKLKLCSRLILVLGVIVSCFCCVSESGFVTLHLEFSNLPNVTFTSEEHISVRIVQKHESPGN